MNSFAINCFNSTFVVNCSADNDTLVVHFRNENHFQSEKFLQLQLHGIMVPNVENVFPH